MLWVTVILVLNFAISWFNAWATGRCWAESKAAGGWPRVMAWAGAVMSASGFTYIFVALLAMAAGAGGLLPPQYVKATMELGYVVVILPILGSGMVIWVDSLMTAWREKTFGSFAVAGWNTYAQIHNTYEAASMLPDVVSDLGDPLGDSDDASGALIMLAVMIVVISLAGGIMLTCAILKSSARATAQERLQGVPA